MKLQLIRQIRRGCLGLALAACTAGPAAFAQNVQVPAVPPGLEAPDGQIAFFTGHAEGTQNYVCLPTASGFGWTFFSPQATLFASIPWFRGEIKQQIVTHFLSPNPAEKGTPRVTWQSSFDSSAAWAKALKPSTDPAFVAAGAIPWVLLEVVGTNAGPAGGRLFAHTTFIQRLNTAGGAAPADGCGEPADVGKTSLVPYTADYFFYRAK